MHFSFSAEEQMVSRKKGAPLQVTLNHQLQKSAVVLGCHSLWKGVAELLVAELRIPRQELHLPSGSHTPARGCAGASGSTGKAEADAAAAQTCLLPDLF